MKEQSNIYFASINEGPLPDKINSNTGQKPTINNLNSNNNKIINEKFSNISPTIKPTPTTSLIHPLFYSEEEKRLELASVIITFTCHGTFDSLFTQQKVKSPEGTRVAVYGVEINRINDFVSYYIDGDKQDLDIKSINLIDQLKSEIERVENDCVLFNFECSSSFCGGKYKKGDIGSSYILPHKNTIHKLLKHLIEKGNYIMFGDFSLKALINDWDYSILGSNPLVIAGQGSESLELSFNPKQLLESNSMQLKAVGELCPKGKLSMNCMSNTIIIGLDRSKIDNDLYQFEILTTAFDYKKANFIENSDKYFVGEGKHYIGHASFKYKTGSCLFISAGHWIELKNLNSDIDTMEKVAFKNFGPSSDVYKEVKSIQTMKQNKQMDYKQAEVKLASKMVQISSNCNYSNQAQSVWNKK